MNATRGILFALACFGYRCLLATESHPLSLEAVGEVWSLVHPSGKDQLQLSRAAPLFDFGEFQIGGAAAGKGKWREEDVNGERRWIGEWSVIQPRSAEIRAVLRLNTTDNLLRKTAELRLKSGPPALLHSVVVDEVDTAGQSLGVNTGWQSYPVLCRSFFFGIEFPVATTRLERDKAFLSHAPGKLVQAGEWFVSRPAIYGAATRGSVREAFEEYIQRLRPTPRGIHVNYNSWWTSPVPYTEADILKIIVDFRQHLFRPYGVSIETFTIDMGWARNTALWEIDPKLFPQGFTNLAAACNDIGSRLGLWISPSGMYAQALDLAWLKRAGYEADTKACLGGARYQAAFKKSLLALTSSCGLRQVKFDGYVPTCTATNHGHPPGALSDETIAEGMIDVFVSLRKLAPDLWMEPTCFGFNPSPWWLAYCNSVIGTFGDDAPHGRVPCPIYRESYTTGRDYYNLKGARDILFPIAAQEVLGIIHQTDEPFQNDAVVTVLRGHQFLPLYINPKNMTPRRWEFLAALLQWARRNQDVLENTRPIFPKSWRRDAAGAVASTEGSMPREPYGYAHAKGDRALVCLRNPWILPAKVHFTPSEDAGLPMRVKNLVAMTLYPEHELLAANSDAARPMEVSLRPYETKLIEFRPSDNQPPPRLSPHQPSSAKLQDLQICRLKFDESGPAFGSNYTQRFSGGGPFLRARFSVRIRAAREASSQLALLVEGPAAVKAPWCKLSSNVLGDNLRSLTFEQTAASGASPVPYEVTSSEAGWRATGAPAPEHWVWLQAPCPGAGESQIRGEVILTDVSQRLSAYLLDRKDLAWKPAAAVDGTSLPGPESLFVAAQELFHTGPSNNLPLLTEAAPVDRIHGIYLDSLTPLSATQGWGKLQRNQSVWEKPLTIGSKTYARGLGTHAPAHIVYSLGGNYRRFTAWAGADHATSPTITMAVSLDDHTVWQSGLLTRESPPQRIELDVNQAKRLELIVNDGGNGLEADHADWVDAVLWP